MNWALFLLALSRTQADLVRRIVGGELAYRYNWIVYLKHPRMMCGGTLYTQSLVITVAHCNKHPVHEWRAQVGRYDLTKSLKEDNANEYNVLHRIDYPLYKYDFQVYDISVWWIQNNSNEPTIVDLDNGTALKHPGRYVTVIGWGTTMVISDIDRKAKKCDTSISDLLKQATLPLVPQRTCEKKYKKGFDPELMICLGNGFSGTGTGSGDSGGPMFVTNGNRITLIGVIRYSGGCGFEDFYDVGTKISHLYFVRFIEFYKPFFNPTNYDSNGKILIEIPDFNPLSSEFPYDLTPVNRKPWYKENMNRLYRSDLSSHNFKSMIPIFKP